MLKYVKVIGSRHIAKAKHVFEGEIAEILRDCNDEEVRTPPIWLRL